MRSIEEIKIDLTLKILRGEFDPSDDFEDLPINDELRTFICSISPYCAYSYAALVDKKPLDETRTAACKDVSSACFYAIFVDKEHHYETEEVVYKDSDWKEEYIRYLGE